MAYADLPTPFPVYVDNRYLHDMEDVEGVTLCDLIGLVSYEGEALMAVVRSAEGGVFFDLPFSGIRVRPGVNLGGRVYQASANGRIEVDVMRNLEGPASLYTADGMLLARGTYLFTVTWVDANLLLFAVLEGNILHFWPPHKTLFGTSPGKLPGWKKRHYPNDAPYTPRHDLSGLAEKFKAFRERRADRDEV